MHRFTLGLIAIKAALIVCPSLSASDTADFFTHAQSALASDSLDLKKEALRPLADPTVGDDDQALPILVRAVNDRQAHDVAVDILRKRTGLRPSPEEGVGGYPSYPENDSPEQWMTWLSARAAQHATEQKLNALLHGLDQINAAIADPGEPDFPESRPSQRRETMLPPPGEGIPSVVELKEGRRIVGNVVSRKVDDEGYLLSIDISHRDSGGLETITADRIADLEIMTH